MTNIPHKPIGGRSKVPLRNRIANALDPMGARLAAQPQPLNDGEELKILDIIDNWYHEHTRHHLVDVDPQVFENLIKPLAAHSPSTEAAELDARIEEQQQLIASIDDNQSDRYPEIVEGDNLTYVSHGHALACKQIKRNAEVRVKQLKAQRAALESVTTDEAGGAQE